MASPPSRGGTGSIVSSSASATESASDHRRRVREAVQQLGDQLLALAVDDKGPRPGSEQHLAAAIDGEARVERDVAVAGPEGAEDAGVGRGGAGAVDGGQGRLAGGFGGCDRGADPRRPQCQLAVAESFRADLEGRPLRCLLGVAQKAAEQGGFSRCSHTSKTSGRHRFLRLCLGIASRLKVRRLRVVVRVWTPISRQRRSWSRRPGEAAAAARAKILDFCGPALAAYGIDPGAASRRSRPPRQRRDRLTRVRRAGGDAGGDVRSRAGAGRHRPRDADRPGAAQRARRRPGRGCEGAAV